MTDRHARMPGSAPRLRPRAARVRGLLLATGLVLAGCGFDGGAAADDAQGGGDAATRQESSDGDPVLAFYQCLRDHGLDVADPSSGEPIGLRGLDTDDPDTMEQVRQCRETHLSSSDGRITVGEGNMGDNLAAPEALINFVDCMRGHDIDMPDPAPDGRLSLPDNADPNDPAFRSAAQECAHHLDGGGILMGQPGSGGMVERRP